MNEADISKFIDKSDLDKKIAALATKATLKREQDKIVKLQAFRSNYFHGKSHFKDDGIRNYFVFQPVLRYFKKYAESNHISA